MDLALFDFDGTITIRETLPDFMSLAVAPGRLVFGKVLLAPLIAGYKLGIVPGTMVRAAIVRFGFSCVPFAIVEEQGRAFAQSTLPPLVRPEAIERIDWHTRRGDTVVVVSGGFDVYLRHWCQEHRLDLICSSLEHRDGSARCSTFRITTGSMPTATPGRTWGCWPSPTSATTAGSCCRRDGPTGRRPRGAVRRLRLT